MALEALCLFGNSSGLSPSDAAVVSGQLNVPCPDDAATGNYPLHVAVLLGNPDTVRDLLAWGADPDRLNKLYR